jgi:hypothetical protein
METYTTTRRTLQEMNAPQCDENHCFCDQVDDYGDQVCQLDTKPPEPQETLDEIIQKILLQLDTINAQIETINSQLKTIQ